MSFPNFLCLVISWKKCTKIVFRLQKGGKSCKTLEKIQNFVKDYQINVDLESAVYGDNIKIKLNVENA